MTDTTRTAETIVSELGAYRLAGMADCASPSSTETAGADFLGRVADATAELIAYRTDEDGETIAEAIAYIREDGAHEIADGAVPIYTHELWSAFVDLGAWQTDTDELCASDADMEQRAKIALYVIAETLVYAIAELVSDELAADEDDER